MISVVTAGNYDASVKLELNATVLLPNGIDAVLEDVVIDPAARRVSHVVVNIPHHAGGVRLVPIEAISESGGELHCDRPIDELPAVEQTQFVELSTPIEVEGEWEVGVQDVSVLPYYRADFVGLEAPPWTFDSEDNVEVTFHRIPKDRVEIRRRSEVVDAEHETIGQVDGFIVDDTDHITHFVLERGHLWGRHDIAIPIGLVDSTKTDYVRLSITAQEVEALPRPKVHSLWHR